MNKLREQVKAFIPICTSKGDDIKEKYRDAIADELINLIRTATLDEVKDAVNVNPPSNRRAHIRVIQAIDNMRGADND